MKQYYDEKLRPINKGDVLKVFHFIGPRNKKYYMYKVVMDFGQDSLFGVSLSDIGTRDLKDCHKYRISYGSDNRGVIEGTEIVEGFHGGYFQNRKRLEINGT